MDNVGAPEGWWSARRVGLLTITLAAFAAAVALVVYMLVVNTRIKDRREGRRQNCAMPD